MKTNKIILLPVLIVVALLVAKFTVAQTSEQTDDQKPPEAAESDVQQKITTPPLQLTEEEAKRIPATDTTTPAGTKPLPTLKAGTTTQGSELKFKPVPLKTKTNIELILDASGSMNGLMGTSTKLALLKSAVNDIITQPLPEGGVREFGLRVYGGQKPSEEADCKDTELLIPVGPLNAQEFKEKIDGIQALGVTPIGLSLEEAAKDFKDTSDTDNVIILVTDGADSCNADLCQIAQKIHTDPQKIIIHVVGFDLDQKAVEALQCVSKNGDGQFSLARTDTELLTSLDQVLMTNIPYNLKIRVMSGATPLPSTIRIYKTGKDDMVREDETAGLKFYQLQPGTYDIEITYTDSKESPPPTKVIKRVEVQATSKAEQVVQFELGMLTLLSLDDTGNSTSATYVLKKKTDPKVTVKFDTGPGPYNLWLTEGTYIATVDAKTTDGLSVSGSAEGLTIKRGGTLTHEFKFQIGKIKLGGKNSKGEPLAISYKITPPGDATKALLEGSAPAEGSTINLPPGKYDIYCSLAVKELKDLPSVKLEGVEIAGGDMLEKIVEVPTAALQLSGKDNKNKPVETLFYVKPSDSQGEATELTSVTEPISLTIPPGRYDIKAVFKSSEMTPPPSVSMTGVTVDAGQTVTKEFIFKFGKIKLLGKNSKGAPKRTNFTIYQVGEEEPVAKLSDITNWTEITLIEGFYDIMAEDMTSRSEMKPTVWVHNAEVKSDAPTPHEAVFTHGKLKMTCRGPNGITLTCDFKVYTYGTDSPLFEGTTDERWKEFDMPPGNYYIEAGYHDIQDEVLLKKWITFDVGEDEMVDQIIRY